MKKAKESSQALELLTDLTDSTTPIAEEDKTLPQKEIIETNEEIDKTKNEKEETTTEDETSHDEHVEKTLSKLDINLSSYDEFSDISKQDKSAIVIKIIIFMIIIALVIGAVYILNNILELGLF